MVRVKCVVNDDFEHITETEIDVDRENVFWWVQMNLSEDEYEFKYYLKRYNDKDHPAGPHNAGAAYLEKSSGALWIMSWIWQDGVAQPVIFIETDGYGHSWMLD